MRKKYVVIRVDSEREINTLGQVDDEKSAYSMMKADFEEKFWEKYCDEKGDFEDVYDRYGYDECRITPNRAWLNELNSVDYDWKIIKVDCSYENNSKPELSIARSLELLTSIIDHVSAGNNCSGTIKKLLQMGFTGEELHSVFNFNLHDIADVEDEIESESEENQII